MNLLSRPTIVWVLLPLLSLGTFAQTVNVQFDTTAGKFYFQDAATMNPYGVEPMTNVPTGASVTFHSSSGIHQIKLDSNGFTGAQFSTTAGSDYVLSNSQIPSFPAHYHCAIHPYMTGTLTTTVQACVPATLALANPASITIPAGAPTVTKGKAAPSPSTINVTGATGPVDTVHVMLNGLSSGRLGDLDLLLVGPTGKKMVILSDLPVGYPTDASGRVNNVVIKIGSGASFAKPPFPCSISRPRTRRGHPSLPWCGPVNLPPLNFGRLDVFPGAPTGYASPWPVGTATLESVFGGTDPNGTWQLFAVDDATGAVSSIADGWGLAITTKCPSP